MELRLTLGLVVILSATNVAEAAASHPAPTLIAAAQKAIKQAEYPLAERYLRSASAIDPDNDEIKFHLARVLSWQAQYADADTLYRDLLGNHPDNADYQLGLAQTLAWRGWRRQAIALLERITDGGRHGPDGVRLLIQSLSAGDAGEKARAERLRVLARKAYPGEDFGAPVATARSDADRSGADPSAPLPNQIELGGSYDALSNGRGSWNSQYLAFSTPLAPRATLYGGAQRTERFDLDDAQFHVGGYLPLSQRWTANLEAGYSPTARVLPRHYELFHLQRSFDGGLVLGAGYRFREYSTAQTHSGLFTAEQYLSNFRLAYTYSPSFLHDQVAHNHLIQLGYWYTDYSFINLSYGTGSELSNIIPFGVVSSPVESYGINGRHWLNPQWAITWSVAHQRQGNFYDRTGAQIGIRMAF